jgi:MoxR-like ATPase
LCNKRTLAKVQSALLEAIQEKTVTIGETSFKLDTRFLVLATQNPVDQKGTYNLPEAQIDRFMLKVKIDYPSKEEELEVMRRMSNMAFKPELKTLLTKEDIFSIRNEENQVSISRSLKKYSIELVYATRNAKALGLDKETYYMQFGASPRASINLN